MSLDRLLGHWILNIFLAPVQWGCHARLLAGLYRTQAPVLPLGSECTQQAGV